MSKIAQELWTVSKQCISDQKLNDSSMNRTRPVPAKPSCWNPGTRIRNQVLPLALAPLHCWPCLLSHPQPPRVHYRLCDPSCTAKTTEMLFDGGHRVKSLMGDLLQLCVSPRDPALSLISATAWMPILEQRDPWEEKWVVGSISFSNGTEVLDRA